MVTHRGFETAVLVLIEERRRLKSAARPSIKELLLPARSSTWFFLSAPGGSAAGQLASPARISSDPLSVGHERHRRVAQDQTTGRSCAWLEGLRVEQIFRSAVTIGRITKRCRVSPSSGCRQSRRDRVRADFCGTVIRFCAAGFGLLSGRVASPGWEARRLAGGCHDRRNRAGSWVRSSPARRKRLQASGNKRHPPLQTRLTA